MDNLGRDFWEPSENIEKMHLLYFEIWWEEEDLHWKHDKNKTQIYDLMTECIEHKKRKYIGDALDILYIQETYLL